MPAIARARYGVPVLALLCVGLSLLAAVLWYLQLKIDLALLFHSDSDYLPALYRDLVQHNGRLSQWYLTPAPSFLPDWPLFFLAHWLAGDFFHALPLFFVLQGGLLFGLAWWLARAVLDSRAAPLAAAFATVLVFYWAMQTVTPYSYFYLSAFHCGAFLLLLLSLRLQHGQACWLLGVVAALAALSDRLYVLQYALPALATLGLLQWRQGLPWKRQAAAILIGSLIGMQLYKLVAHAHKLPWGLSLAGIDSNLAQLGGMLAQTWQRAPLCLTLLIAYYLAVSLLLPGTLAGRGWRIRQPLAAQLAVFSWLSGAAGVAVVLVSTNDFTVRYFIPAFVLPLLLGPLLLYSCLPQRWQRHLPVLLMALTAGLTLKMLLPQLRDLDQVRQAYYPPQVACMDAMLAQHKLRRGIANYWDAKRYGMLSRTQPVIASYTSQLNGMRWITSEAVFSQSYDFALISHEVDVLDAAALIRLNGVPAARADCGNFEVLAWPDGGLQHGLH